MTPDSPSKPPAMDDRVKIPLDPETALRGLLEVRPDVPPYPLNGQDLADKHGVDGLSLRNMFRRHPDLVDGHTKWAHYEINREAEARILAHPEFQTLLRSRRP